VTWHRWPTANGPSGILDERRPYRLERDGRIVVPTRRERAAERASRPRRVRRVAQPLTVALAAYLR
jgi:hypothetical protein